MGHAYDVQRESKGYYYFVNVSYARICRNFNFVRSSMHVEFYMCNLYLKFEKKNSKAEQALSFYRFEKKKKSWSN